MSFGDFNHDGHTSLPEAMYAYGMLEDSDTGGSRNEDPIGGGDGCGGCLLWCVVMFVGFCVLCCFGSCMTSF